jgi:hypothetical protein
MTMTIRRQLLKVLMVAAALECSRPLAAQAQGDPRARAQQRLAQTDQHALAQQLLGDSAAERANAVAVAETLGAANTGPALRAALVAALEREGRLLRERSQAARKGAALEELEDPEFIAHAARTVAELHDPGTIPALVNYGLGTGGPPIDTLAAFGEQAAPAVLAAVMSPDTPHDTVDSGLITLRFMVEGRASRALSAGTIAQIRRAAEQHLATGKGLQITTLWWAIDLAIALNDAKLRGIVQSIASDQNAVLDRGVVDLQLVAQTQKRAADRLAGIPPLPRP